MFTVYILSSKKSPRTYVGYTNDLKKRIICYHNSGKVIATKFFLPWELLYAEIVNSLKEAKMREKYWKSGAGRRNIGKILSGFPPRFQSGRGSRSI